jgi:hypothetical protein
MREYRVLRQERNVTRWQHAALTDSTAELRDELADMDAQALGHLVEGLPKQLAEYMVSLYGQEPCEHAIAQIAADLDSQLNSVEFAETALPPDDSEPIRTVEVGTMTIHPRPRQRDSEPIDTATLGETDN